MIFGTAVQKALNPQQLKLGLGHGRSLREFVPGSNLYDADILTVENHRVRVLGTFHTFILFAEQQHDTEFKRMMRDYVHYVPKLFEYASMAVDELGGVGTYSALHIRRGDFQYQEVKLEAEHLYSNLEPLLHRRHLTPI